MILIKAEGKIFEPHFEVEKLKNSVCILDNAQKILELLGGMG